MCILARLFPVAAARLRVRDSEYRLRARRRAGGSSSRARTAPLRARFEQAMSFSSPAAPKSLGRRQGTCHAVAEGADKASVLAEFEKRLPARHLHVRQWPNALRQGGKGTVPNCTHDTACSTAASTIGIFLWDDLSNAHQKALLASIMRPRSTTSRLTCATWPTPPESPASNWGACPGGRDRPRVQPCCPSSSLLSWMSESLRL
jgi:hypothetical protein